MRRLFSTGSPEFDRYLGGIRDGDSLLVLQGARGESQPLLRNVLSHARLHDLPVFYINFTGSRDFLLTGIACRRVQLPTSARRRPESALRWVSGRLKELKTGEILLLDDLDDWKELLDGGGKLIRLFKTMCALVAKKKAFLTTTAVRGSFGPSTLAMLTESASLCVDLSTHSGDLLLTPVRMEGRFRTGPPAPFGFRMSGRGSGRGRRLMPISDFQASGGGKIRADFFNRGEIAARILGGPLAGAPFGLVVADLEGSFRVVNDHLRKLLGIIAPDAELAPVETFLHPGQRWPLLRFIARSKKNLNPTATFGAVSARGSSVPIRVRSIAVEGDLTLFIVEENRSNVELDRRLRDLQRQVDTLFGGNPLPLCYADRKKLIGVNTAFSRLRGAATGWTGTLPLPSAFPPRTLRLLREGMDAVLPAGDRVTIRGHLLRSDGSELPVRISIAPAGEGRAGQCALAVEDISEFTSRIASLEENDRRFRTIAEQISRPVALLQGKTLVYCNPPCVELIGPGEAEKFRGRTLTDLVPPEEREGVDAALTKFLASRQTSSGSTRRSSRRRGTGSASGSPSGRSRASRTPASSWNSRT